jgi:hypothetical protein
VAVIASRGAAAQQVGPETTTIYSFTGYSFDDHIYELSRSKWNDFDVFIIDDISVLSSTLKRLKNVRTLRMIMIYPWKVYK